MADVKKDTQKSETKGGAFGFEEVILLIFAIITIFFVTIPRLSQKEHTESGTVSVRNFYDKVFNEQKIDEHTVEPSLIDQTKFRVIDAVKNIFYGSIIFAIFFTLLFWILKSYLAFKLQVVVHTYQQNLGIEPVITAEESPDTQPVPTGYVSDTNGIQNPTWNMIQTYAQSGNPAELRLAIIEADIMLFDVLTQSGFQGANLGEVLTRINRSQLATIDHAWRAHKVRNELAHRGSNYILGRTEAETALNDYKKVFDELDLI